MKKCGLECPLVLAHPMAVTVVDLGDVKAGGLIPMAAITLGVPAGGPFNQHCI